MTDLLDKAINFAMNFTSITPLEKILVLLQEIGHGLDVIIMRALMLQ